MKYRIIVLLQLALNQRNQCFIEGNSLLPSGGSRLRLLRVEVEAAGAAQAEVVGVGVGVAVVVGEPAGPGGGEVHDGAAAVPVLRRPHRSGSSRQPIYIAREEEGGGG